MTDDNTDTSNDTTDRETNTGTVAMATIEDETGFLDDRDPEEYPAVLRLTANSEDKHQQDALDRLARWEAGEEVPHVVNFQKPSDLRALLTDRRVELLQSVMTESPDSIRRLAQRLDRDVKSVHDDLQVLAEYDIVHFESEGRAKRPFVPYDTIEITLEISRPDRADDAAPA